MKIAIASDHGGFDLKKEVVEYLKEKGYEVKDLGTHSNESVDYADYAKPVCEMVRREEGTNGILICGTGLGMSMSANKIKGIRAACVAEPFSAKMAKEHNNANVLCFGARVLGIELVKMILDEYLDNEFEGGRHQRRIDKIMALEGEL
ncbi:MAG: ribose 5-phosphate isomerase B [Tissierellia bacterium]|nr:ribose 5-phosphate isomerase B [Tissierellia bacterium]